MNHICFNGKYFDAGQPVLLASNRSYRYGDGVFETMKVQQGKILLSDYHFERLFNSLDLLKFKKNKLLTRDKLEQDILRLCQKNAVEKLARVRLSFSRGNGGLYDEDKETEWLIESWALNESVNQLNENGLVIGIYPDVQKATGKFSNIKSANFQLYSMAALFAKENKLNDCLVLNSSGNIADSTIANLFIIKNEKVFTPSLNEGCINGVMRRYLVEKLSGSVYSVLETVVTTEDLVQADEIFLTNAINGIRWVQLFNGKNYSNQQTKAISRFLAATISA